MRIFSNRDRPVPLGAFPLERLSREPLLPHVLLEAKLAEPAWAPAAENLLAKHCERYAEMYAPYAVGDPFPELAPYTQDLGERASDVKGLAYFFDATLVGTCSIPEIAWVGEPIADHTHGIVILVEYGPEAQPENLVADMIRSSDGAGARLRASEIGVIMALYLRRLGFTAQAHTPFYGSISGWAMALQAGLGRWSKGKVVPPFIDNRFAVAVVTTNMQLSEDLPLGSKRRFEGGAAWWFGTGGTETWWNRNSRLARMADGGRYPMERVKKADDYTSLILHDEIPRVPKRMDGFLRAEIGDFGSKASRESDRFWCKTPFADSTRVLMYAQQPYQTGEVATERHPAWNDPIRNAKAIKALAHHLGSDLVGNCEARPYVWYSHQPDGTPIDIYDKSAIVMLIDQGFESMEGASGDDWISGTQSARAYLRGAQIAGVIGAIIRDVGYSATAHTSRHSDVIQPPLVILAGLGELSRIGETFLNPFIGPRSKSAVTTTNLPLAYDPPIDFALQDICGLCRKCARECPCDAITYGDQVVFNGYAQWKQDVQRCTSYRVTNMGGAACGRCMKTCPYNNEGLAIHRVLMWMSQKFPFMRQWLIDLDDRVGNGTINEAKRWWQDLEVMPDGSVIVPKRTNRRELDIAKGTSFAPKQKIGYVNANMQPKPDLAEPFTIDRQVQFDAGEVLESPAEAKARHAAGKPRPAHYIPTYEGEP